MIAHRDTPTSGSPNHDTSNASHKHSTLQTRHPSSSPSHHRTYPSIVLGTPQQPNKFRLRQNCRMRVYAFCTVTQLGYHSTFTRIQEMRYNKQSSHYIVHTKSHRHHPNNACVNHSAPISLAQPKKTCESRRGSDNETGQTASLAQTTHHKNPHIVPTLRAQIVSRASPVH